MDRPSHTFLAFSNQTFSIRLKYTHFQCTASMRTITPVRQTFNKKNRASSFKIVSKSYQTYQQHAWHLYRYEHKRDQNSKPEHNGIPPGGIHIFFRLLFCGALNTSSPVMRVLRKDSTTATWHIISHNSQTPEGNGIFSSLSQGSNI